MDARWRCSPYLQELTPTTSVLDVGRRLRYRLQTLTLETSRLQPASNLGSLAVEGTSAVGGVVTWRLSIWFFAVLTLEDWELIAIPGESRGTVQNRVGGCLVLMLACFSWLRHGETSRRPHSFLIRNISV